MATQQQKGFSMLKLEAVILKAQLHKDYRCSLPGLADFILMKSLLGQPLITQA